MSSANLESSESTGNTPESLGDPLSRALSCPFCGLVCDDIEIDGAKLKGVCALGRKGFEAAQAEPASPMVRGRAVSLEQAILTASEILNRSHQALVGGLACDVEGAQAALAMAERCGAISDHCNSATRLRNTRALQEAGGILTTMSEVRNRADLVVFVGDDHQAAFPRANERLFGTGLFLNDQPRAFAAIGPVCDRGVPLAAGLACANNELPGLFGLISTRVRGLPVPLAEGDPTLVEVDRLVTGLLAAKYPVFIWNAASFVGEHGELTVLAILQLIQWLNRNSRAAALPLGGSLGDGSVEAVHLWQSGFPARIGFGGGSAHFDPYHFGSERLLERGEVDTLVWISSLTDELPAFARRALRSTAPPSAAKHLSLIRRLPSILLAHPAMVLRPDEADVIIPVAVPGAHHAATLFRLDRVVAIPLRSLRVSTLPSVASVLNAITAKLEWRGR